MAPNSNEAFNLLAEVEITLEHCRRFLLARDEMNAAVHLDSVKYSPLTVEAIAAVGKIRNFFALSLALDDFEAKEAAKKEGPHFPQADKDL